MNSLVSQNLVTFTSSIFNATEPMAQFTYPFYVGKDLACWLVEQLNRSNVRTHNSPIPRDYGWYIIFTPKRVAHRFALSLMHPDNHGRAEWLGCVERSAFSALFLGKRARIPEDSALEIIHRVLSSSSSIQDIEWHTEEDLEGKYRADLNLPPSASGSA
jgi:hypothetical protein